MKPIRPVMPKLVREIKGNVWFAYFVTNENVDELCRMFNAVWIRGMDNTVQIDIPGKNEIMTVRFDTWFLWSGMDFNHCSTKDFRTSSKESLIKDYEEIL